MNLLLVALMTIFVFNLNAQIIYYDIVPDGQPAGIDFNQDGTNEFDITSQNKLGDYIEYFAYGVDNNIHAVGTYDNGNGDSWDVPDFVAQGFTIDASNQWEGQGDAYPNGDFSASGNNPTIIAGTDQYMAVRFNLGGTDIYYGWVRVNINTNGDVTYKDYAYNSVAGQAITAGQMPQAGVLVTSITVQGQGGVSTITTQGGTLQMEATVLPANATDNSVTWSVTPGTGSATIDANGLLTATGDGTVTVTATANDASGVTGSTVITISNQSVGINEISNNQLSLFPNPASDYVNMASSEKYTTIIITDLSGRLMKSINVTNRDNIKIDLSHLDTGVYLINLYQKNELINRSKIVLK